MVCDIKENTESRVDPLRALYRAKHPTATRFNA